jgi:hypothetical protein
LISEHRKVPRLPLVILDSFPCSRWRRSRSAPRILTSRARSLVRVVSWRYSRTDNGARGKSACGSGRKTPPMAVTMTETAGRRGRGAARSENALTVINSSVDRIQIESLPANRVIVASAELLRPLFPPFGKSPGTK